ncbi:13537_t:CDS:2 [Racocetra fulgida]|uniref:13537_t:CDS:1 n=1 Tax=Racocetra fulgida TaxID=60492 RepID=A0A9N9IZ12_9GLOM|nr:13537_t:CDS:2 [Racocetra fulgida]
MKKQYFYGTVDYSSLVKARNTLDRILQTSQNEAEKMGVIMKKVLEFRGVEVGAARDVFREAARLKNVTVHAYQPEILDDLFANTAKEFLKNLDYLLNQIEKEAPKYATNRN